MLEFASWPDISSLAPAKQGERAAHRDAKRRIGLDIWPGRSASAARQESPLPVGARRAGGVEGIA